MSHCIGQYCCLLVEYSLKLAYSFSVHVYDKYILPMNDTLQKLIKYINISTYIT